MYLLFIYDPFENVVFSSTRQWNPGDEFIQFGCQNLMSNLINFNSILFNRNPQIRGSYDTNHPFLNANHSHKFNTSFINSLIGKYIKLNFGITHLKITEGMELTIASYQDPPNGVAVD